MKKTYKKRFDAAFWDRLLVRPKSEKIRMDLQGLRALAVIAVLVYHIAPSRMRGGFAGVDIFFVLSGYLMTTSIMKMVAKRATYEKGKKKGKIKRGENVKMFLEFYARRIRRLLPASLVVLFVVFGAVWVSGLYDLQIKTAEQVESSALFYQNWKLADLSVDYMRSSESATAVQHFWSLSLEEQFYAMWPAAILILATVAAFLARGKWRSKLLKKLKKNQSVVLLVATTVLMVASFVYGYKLTEADPNAAYFVTWARLWELLAGGVLVFLPKIKDVELKLLLPWLGIVLCGWSIFRMSSSTPYPGWHAAIPVLGAMLVIIGGSDGKWSINNLARLRPVQWIGDISYSLYLWHWPVVILLPVFLEKSLDTTKMKLLALVLSLGLAALSYYFIETPFREKKRGKNLQGQSL